MEMIRLNKYVLKNPNRQKLKSLGYKYNRNLSDSDEEFYSFKFPLVKTDSGFFPLLGEVTVSLISGEVRVNVYQNSGETYALFYREKIEPTYETIISRINSLFDKVFNKTGIEKVRLL